ncbi:MAG: hypothetical protein LUI08_04030 [Prevotella sp.]|nr:hypothetical protein [Prevotella sp.]
MTNADFLKAISLSFKEFISSGTSRSTRKLKPLHGAIAKDIAARLGDGYEVHSQGYGDDKEAAVKGRYYDKMVDIAISDGKKAVCGIAVKFIMQNYSQNSNNYFENMLGETANIRCANCPYFQIIIILDELPYYKRDKTISRWETFTEHNAGKYITLSKDDASTFMHTPNKTLLFVVHIPRKGDACNLQQYRKLFARKKVNVELSTKELHAFDDAVILNDYETFMDKVYHTIKAI